MKFGFFLSMYLKDRSQSYQRLIDEAIEIAQAAEDLGYEAIYIPEHHFINYITLPSALTLAVKLAEHTKRIKFVTAVIVLPYWHPLSLAEEIATADHLTRGRIEVGVARGANKYEFDRLGLDMSKAREVYEESLDIILKAMTTENFEHQGQFYKFGPTTTMPRPYSQPHPPVWIAGQSPTGMRNAAQRGFNVMSSPLYGCFAPFEDLKYTLGVYDEAVKELGVERKKVGLLRRVYIGENRAEAESVLPDLLEHWGRYMAFFDRADLNFRVEKPDVPVDGGFVTPAGLDLPLDDLQNRYDDPILTDAEGAVNRIRKYEDLGVDYLLTNTAFGIPHAKVLASMQRLAKDVMPHFRAPVPTGD